MINFNYKKTLIFILGCLISTFSNQIFCMRHQPNQFIPTQKIANPTDIEKEKILKEIIETGSYENEFNNQIQNNPELFYDVALIAALKPEISKKTNAGINNYEIAKIISSIKILITPNFTANNTNANVLYYILDKKDNIELFKAFLYLLKTCLNKETFKNLLKETISYDSISNNSLLTYAIFKNKSDELIELILSHLNSYNLHKENLFSLGANSLKSFFNTISNNKPNLLGLLSKYYKFTADEKKQIIQLNDKIDPKETIINSLIDCRKYDNAGWLLIIFNEDEISLPEIKTMIKDIPSRIITSLGYKAGEAKFENVIDEGIKLLSFVIRKFKIDLNDYPAYIGENDKRPAIHELSRMLEGSKIHTEKYSPGDKYAHKKKDNPRRVDLNTAKKILNILMSYSVNLNKNYEKTGSPANSFIGWLKNDIQSALEAFMLNGNKSLEDRKIEPIELLKFRIELLKHLNYFDKKDLIDTLNKNLGSRRATPAYTEDLINYLKSLHDPEFNTVIETLEKYKIEHAKELLDHNNRLDEMLKQFS